MDLGFDTIGNATLIGYDGGPVVVTDPWIYGSAYFGSWTLSHKVPEEQERAILDVKHVWLSHGHPDHLSGETLEKLKGKELLLANHEGQRIRRDLESQGYRVRVLPDRQWVNLTPRLRVMTIADYNQDSIFLMDVGGTLVVNLNDASDRGWGRFVKELAKGYRKRFLVALSGYGDADMINFWDEDGQRIPPKSAAKIPPGIEIARMCDAVHADYFIPFSSMHHYQRSDSVWANEYTTKLDDYAKGFASDHAEMLPAFMRYDAATDQLSEISPPENPPRVIDSKEFGDDWSDTLSPEDVAAISDYFKSVEHLGKVMQFVRFRVGGREHTIDLSDGSGNTRGRGITFETPRKSLMSSVEWRVFDDLLIGNYMKTTLHGKWGDDKLYPDFTPYLAKYGDNGLARTEDELRRYFRAYLLRAPMDYIRHRIERTGQGALEGTVGAMFRRMVPRESAVFQVAKKAYWSIRKRL